MKHRLLTVFAYSLYVFLIMLIGFNWAISLSIGFILGLILGMLNEIITLLKDK